MSYQILWNFWVEDDYEATEPPEISDELKKQIQRKIQTIGRRFCPKFFEKSILWQLIKKYTVWDVYNILYELDEDNKGDTSDIKYLNGYVMISVGIFEPIIWCLAGFPIVCFIYLFFSFPFINIISLAMGLQEYPFLFVLILILFTITISFLIPVNYELELKVWNLMCQSFSLIIMLVIMASFDLSDGSVQFQKYYFFYSHIEYKLPTAGYEKYYIYMALAKGIKTWIVATLPTSLTFGGDILSLLLVALTTYLFFVGFLLNWYSISKFIKEINICLQLLQFFIIAALTTMDVVWFYIFFEACLIPLFLLIGIWGSREQKVSAAYKLFFYTLISSAFTLVGFLLLVNLWNKSIGDITYLELVTIDKWMQKYLFLLLFISFAVKLPIVPVHLWLPEAHVEAPTVVSVILAGILLKLGAYGFYRFLIPLFPNSLDFYNPMINFLGLISIFYSSLIALRLNDLKKIIAYSSIAHMGLITLILANINDISLLGGVVNLISHGFISAALFALIGVLYDRYKSRNLFYYSGLAVTMPVFSIIFFLSVLGNLGFPGFSSFISEFSIFAGVANKNPIVMMCSVVSVVTNALVALWLFNRMVFSKISTKFIPVYQDINIIECGALLALVIPTVIVGIWPLFLGDFIDVYVERLSIISIFKQLISKSQ